MSLRQMTGQVRDDHHPLDDARRHVDRLDIGLGAGRTSSLMNHGSGRRRCFGADDVRSVKHGYAEEEAEGLTSCDGVRSPDR